MNNIFSKVAAKICVPTQTGFNILKLEEIIYCEAARSYTTFHLINDKKVTISNPLAHYEKILCDGTFFRVHKSFLINFLHIKEYWRGNGGIAIMSNSKEIEVSRRRKESFLAKIEESLIYLKAS